MKYRIKIFRDHVEVFVLKQDGMWKQISTSKNLNSCFYENWEEFKPKDFHISENSVVPVILQNF